MSEASLGWDATLRATGHRYTVNVLACRRCYETFHRWYRARMRSNPIAHAAMKEVK